MRGPRWGLGRPEWALVLAVLAIRWISTAVLVHGDLVLQTHATAATAYDFGNDSTAYFDIARHLARGQGYAHYGQPDIRWPPLYPLVLAGLIRVVGERPQVLLYAHGGFDSLTTLLLLMLAWRLGLARWARWLAALLQAVWPGFVWYHNDLMTESLFACLVTGMALLFVSALHGNRYREWLAGSLVLGTSLLCRGTLLFFPLVLAGIAGLARAAPLRGRLLWMATVVVVPACMLAPWSVRTSRLVGETVLLPVGGAHPLLVGTWFGNAARDNPAAPAWQEILAQVEAEVNGDDDGFHRIVMWERAAQRLAWQRMRDRPWTYLGLVPVKIWRFWFPTISGWPQAMGALALVGVYLLALVGFGGLLRSATRPAWFLGAVLCYPALLHGFLYSQFRYSEPFRPLVFVLAAGGVALLVCGRLGGRVALVAGGDAEGR